MNQHTSPAGNDDHCAAAALAYRHQEQARRLGWTTAHADTMTWASTGDLHHDERGFYRTGHAGRGRAVARARVQALIDAALLTLNGTQVQLTADGQAALTAWRAAGITPATDEAAELPPLYGGQEARRRHDQWQADMARHEAQVYAALEQAIAQAEASYEAELERRREREATQPRYHSVWDAIYAPDEPSVAPEDNLGNVETFSGIDPADPIETGPVETAPEAGLGAAAAVSQARTVEIGQPANVRRSCTPAIVCRRCQYQAPPGPPRPRRAPSGPGRTVAISGTRTRGPTPADRDSTGIAPAHDRQRSPSAWALAPPHAPAGPPPRIKRETPIQNSQRPSLHGGIHERIPQRARRRPLHPRSGSDHVLGGVPHRHRAHRPRPAANPAGHHRPRHRPGLHRGAGARARRAVEHAAARLPRPRGAPLRTGGQARLSPAPH